jgi:hypothetical protein
MDAGEVEPKSRHGRRRVPIPAVLRDYLVERRLAAGEARHVFGGARRGAEDDRARHRGPARGGAGAAADVEAVTQLRRRLAFLAPGFLPQPLFEERRVVNQFVDVGILSSRFALE